MGEANITPEESENYFGAQSNGLYLLFNFHVNQHLFSTLATGRIGPLSEALRATRQIPPLAQWAQFLRNHDELDLGRLTEEQRAEVFARFGPDPAMQLYGRGIRRRLAPMLNDRHQLELAYSLLFSLPGTPVIRYGEEIGMGEDLALPGREAIRTPMQWSSEPQAGFSQASNLIRPVISQGAYHYQQVNVADQRRRQDSLLTWMVQLIRRRQECPEIGWGEWTLLDTGSPQVLAMRYDWHGNSLLILHNFVPTPQCIEIDPGVSQGGRLVNLQVEEESRADLQGRHRLALEPYGYRWHRLGSLKPALQRAHG